MTEAQIQSARVAMESLVPHQVWFEGAATSPMLPDYESARQWAISHDQATQEGKWLHRAPGVSILSEFEIVRMLGEQGLEDIL